MDLRCKKQRPCHIRRTPACNVYRGGGTNVNLVVQTVYFKESFPLVEASLKEPKQNNKKPTRAIKNGWDISHPSHVVPTPLWIKILHGTAWSMCYFTALNQHLLFTLEKKTLVFCGGVRLGAYVAVAACFSVKYIIILLLIDDVKFLEIAIWIPLSRKFIGKFSWLKLGFKNEMKILRKHLALKSFWLVWCTWNFSVYNFEIW